MSLPDFVGDPQMILGPLDSGPKLYGGCPDIEGVSDGQDGNHDEGVTSRAEKVEQLGPFVHHNSRKWLTSDDPPCPSDRWCGDSASVPSEAMVRSCLQCVAHRGVKLKYRC